MKHPSHERFVEGMFLYMEILSLANKLFNKWVNKNSLYNDVSSFFAASGLFFLKLIKIIGIIQFTNFYNYNLWIKLF